MARLLFEAAMKRVSPPWLQRLIGGAFMESLGVPTDDVTDDSSDGVKLRFPNADNPEALGFIGRERRILRGPGETGTTFAARLLRWWDAHRIRGGHVALLTQLFEFFLESNPMPIQYIANSGTSATIDVAGVITRGTVAGWTGDGLYPTKWARFFLVYFLPIDFFAAPLFTEEGELFLTEEDEQLFVDIFPADLTAAEIDIICAVPREWSAAHIDRIYITVVPLDGIAWGIPETLEWGDAGRTWGGGLSAAIVC